MPSSTRIITPTNTGFTLQRRSLKPLLSTSSTSPGQRFNKVSKLSRFLDVIEVVNTPMTSSPATSRIKVPFVI